MNEAMNIWGEPWQCRIQFHGLSYKGRAWTKVFWTNFYGPSTRVLALDSTIHVKSMSVTNSVACPRFGSCQFLTSVFHDVINSHINGIWLGSDTHLTWFGPTRGPPKEIKFDLPAQITWPCIINKNKWSLMVVQNRLSSVNTFGLDPSRTMGPNTTTHVRLLNASRSNKKLMFPYITI